ncbi:hypothetical protein HMPREF3156_01621 [Neisseria sp. HMSC06F02]|nr:hypothetical protein HMPREF3156_01621 [Neisseria sp. HMSC06F02]
MAVVVAARNRGRRGADLRFGFVLQRFPKGGIEIFQLFKSETAHQTGRAAGGNPRGFDDDGAAAAKRVLKRLRAVIARQQQQTRSQVFAHRRFARILAVAAFEQGFAGCVDENLNVALVDKGMDADVGADFADTGARAASVAEHVAYGVFDFQPDEIQTFDLGAFAFYFDFEGLFQVEPIRPADIFRRFINVLLAAVAAFGQAQQHAAGGARMQVDAVNLLHTAFARDAAVNGADVLAFEVFEFLG